MLNIYRDTIQPLISDYADTWRLLLEYDEDRLEMPPDAVAARHALDYESVAAAILEFKRVLAAEGQASSFFASARDDALQGILGSLEQTMFGEPLYRSREEKAAHVLYFIVKDHPFVDGNKRIGSLMFLLYLEQEGMADRINPQALTVLALLVAQSAPSGKDLLIRLIANLLTAPGGRGAHTAPATPLGERTTKSTDQPTRQSMESSDGQSFQIPHPLQDLAGVRVSTKPIPESVYDYVIKRDWKIFKRLARV